MSAASRSLRKARWAMRVRPSVRAEHKTLIRERAATGAAPTYLEGPIIEHLAFDLFTPVSLCMRTSGGTTSTSHNRTLIGVTCRRCVHLWNEGVADARNDLAKQALVEEPVS